MSGNHPMPQRIGDAERDAAAKFLQDHLAEGRLEPAEFDERLSAALEAKTQADLDRLFTDLPSPTPSSPGEDSPSQELAPKPEPTAVPELINKKRLSTGVAVVMSVIWPLTLLTLFLTHWEQWYLIFVPIIASSIWGRLKAQERAEREQLEQEHKRQLGEGDSAAGGGSGSH